MTGRHLYKRSFTLAGHRTSVALEPAFWSALEQVAGQKRITLSALVQQVDASRVEPDLPLASALRVHALVAGQDRAMSAPPEPAIIAAGDGG